MLKLETLINRDTGHQRVLVVTGAYQSGKSTFIQTLTNQSPMPVNVDYYYNTEVIENNFVDYKIETDKHLLVLEVPGALRFDPMRQAFKEILLGQIMIFDSSDPSAFRSVRSIINSDSGVEPHVIVANSHNTDDAWTLEELTTVLQLSDEQLLLSCDARNPAQVAQVVLKLIDDVPDSAFAGSLRSHPQNILNS